LRKLAKLITYAKDGSLQSRFEHWRKEQKYARRRKLWNRQVAAHPMFDYKIEAGARINLYKDDRLSELVFVEDFELNERIFVQRYLKRGDTFVDVGANIGLFTLIGARCVGAPGRVYALEPTDATYARLIQNVGHNQLTNVQCMNVALSDVDEALMMITSLDGYAAWNSLAQPTAGTHFRQEQVQGLTLDTFVAQEGLAGRIHLIKIDIEGWEFYMLKGGQATLGCADAPDLLVEFTEVNARAAGVTGTAVYELLEAFGYKLYRIDATKKVLYPAPAQPYEWDNLLATKTLDQVCKRTGYRYVTQ
jgi:FkbM family methyltransferase